MDVVLRTSIRRTLAVTLVIAVFAAGWILHGVAASPSRDAAAHHATAKLTAADLLVAAKSATAGIYLQYDGITGPPGGPYSGDAPIQSFSFGVSRAVGGSGPTRSAGTPHLSDIAISHAMDKFSAPLFQESLTGAGSADAVLYFTDLNTKGGLVKYLEIDLTNVILTSFQTSSGGTNPNESLSLNFAAVTLIAHMPGAPVQTVTYNIP